MQILILLIKRHKSFYKCQTINQLNNGLFAIYQMPKNILKFLIALTKEAISQLKQGAAKGLLGH